MTGPFKGDRVSDSSHVNLMAVQCAIPTPKQKIEIYLCGFSFLRLFSSGSMTNDSNRLLTDFAQNGSEAAFCDLVKRYTDLVYSAAFRLVDGDTLLAQDITQTVFVDLALMARKLSSEVMLGGW